MDKLRYVQTQLQRQERRIRALERWRNMAGPSLLLLVIMAAYFAWQQL